MRASSICCHYSTATRAAGSASSTCRPTPSVSETGPVAVAVVSSAQDGDPAVMMAIIVMVGVVVILVNTAADILYAVADPRVRLS